MRNQGNSHGNSRKNNQGVVLVSMLVLLLIAGAGAWVLFGTAGGTKDKPRYIKPGAPQVESTR